MIKITRKKDFDIIFKHGKSYKDGFLVLKCVKNNTKESRVAFMVSTKVSKSAVKRNLIRRRLSEVLRKEEKMKHGYDLVFMALPGMEKADFPKTEAMVKNLLRVLH